PGAGWYGREPRRQQPGPPRLRTRPRSPEQCAVVRERPVDRVAEDDRVACGEQDPLREAEGQMARDGANVRLLDDPAQAVLELVRARKDVTAAVEPTAPVVVAEDHREGRSCRAWNVDEYQRRLGGLRRPVRF